MAIADELRYDPVDDVDRMAKSNAGGSIRRAI